jgi:hypothetical protein
MPLIAVSTFRAIVGLDSRADETALGLALASAGAKLKAWVGDAAYADAATDPATDADRQAALQLAEANLGMYYALPLVGLRLVGGGVAQSVKLADGQAITDLSAEDADRVRRRYLDAAKDSAAPYLKKTGRGAPAVGVIDPLGIDAAARARLKIPTY